MNSCLYECAVMHARLSPRPHRFVYRIFMLAVDLDELDQVGRLAPWLSVNRSNLFSFRERDYLPVGETAFNAAPDHRPIAHTGGLKDRVIAYLGQHHIDLAGGRVLLVTLPRIAGYGFNPVSFYFCYDATGQPRAAIAEVTNTFHEMKPFLLGPETFAADAGAFHRRQAKHFYVSPFTDVDVAFDFTLRVPGERLAVQIDDYRESERSLTSTVTGERHALTATRLAWYTVKFPSLTLRVIGLIHWHAFCLWLKRVPWFAKAARPADQRDLYRPHHSLQPSDSA
jgi:DUF1365 family protein